MTETIFIATVLYVAYIVYLAKVSCDDKKSADSPAPIVATKTEVSSAVTEKKKPATTKPVNKESAVNQPAAKKATVATAKMPAGTLRNPDTGDLVKLANSYQMTKKWIKEALVSEGLLEKIYKANELDEATKVIIYGALDKLKTMSKYQ